MDGINDYPHLCQSDPGDETDEPVKFQQHTFKPLTPEEIRKLNEEL
jgi:hypothetical protein